MSKSSKSKSSRSRSPKDAGIAKLEHWIDQTVNRRSVHYEREVYNIINGILQHKEALKYEHVFKDWALSAARQPTRGQRQLIQEALPINKDTGNNMGNANARDTGELRIATLYPTFNDTTDNNLNNGDGDNSGGKQNGVLQFIGSLLQPHILQMRADNRNILIWLCAGAPGSKIDGHMNGSDEFSKNIVDDDLVATHHADGSHPLSDIIDPGIAGMILDCLKARFKDFVTLLDASVWGRLSQVKDIF